MTDERDRSQHRGDSPVPSGRDAEGRDGVDINELEADNEVEQDTLETVDPDNPPA